ncbi:MAG TPA: 3,4-dihydroxy-2-butanone-4-phosphate synthase [Thermoplasmatales archaeon]|nr:3,4-dihydroxy-2-butanone-4-phosphate synthase [Thermoplasmatales archaeon]
MESKEKVERAIKDLKQGKFVLIYDADAREKETDLIISAEFALPESIKTMRKDGGGLIVLMVASEIASKLKLPYMVDMYDKIKDMYPILDSLYPNDIPYDSKSSFSLSINHRETFTGITDIDRSLTARRFAQISKLEDPLSTFGKEFRSPGHVPICIAARDLLKERKGHTELSVALLKMAHLTPVALGCEMMGDDGKSLSKDDALRYAKRHRLTFLEGEEIEEVWREWSE